MTKDWVHGFGHSPVCQIVVKVVITSSPTAGTTSAGMLTAASTSLRRIGWSSSVSVWGQSSTDGSPLALWLYSSAQYAVHRFSISCSSVQINHTRYCLGVEKNPHKIYPKSQNVSNVAMEITPTFSWQWSLSAALYWWSNSASFYTSLPSSNQLCDVLTI